MGVHATVSHDNEGGTYVSLQHDTKTWAIDNIADVTAYKITDEPDGSKTHHVSLRNGGSFYLNVKADGSFGAQGGKHIDLRISNEGLDRGISAYSGD